MSFVYNFGTEKRITSLHVHLTLLIFCKGKQLLTVFSSQQPTPWTQSLYGIKNKGIQNKILNSYIIKNIYILQYTLQYFYVHP